MLKKKNEFETSKNEKLQECKRNISVDNWSMKNKEEFILYLYSDNIVTHITRKTLSNVIEL